MHLTATESAETIPGLHGPNTPTPAAYGGLGMVCASVSIIYCRCGNILIIF
jgi:hypothetical protein